MKSRSVVLVLITLLLFSVAIFATPFPAASVARAADGTFTPTPTQGSDEATPTSHPATPIATPTGSPGNQNFSYRFRGNGAQGSWQHVDATGCIYTYTYLGFTDSTSQSQAGQPAEQTGAWVAVFHFDVCHNLYAGEENGSTALSNGQFSIDNALNQATLNVTIPTYDGDSLTPAYDLQVNVVWTGIGEMVRDNHTVRIEWGNYKYISHLDGKSRSATMSGSISNGTTDFAATNAASGYLFSVKTAVVGIEMNQSTDPNNAKKIFDEHFQGTGARGMWNSVDKTGCVHTSTFLVVRDSTMKIDPGQPAEQTSAFIDIIRYDACQDVYLAGYYGYTPLAEGEFAIDKKLNQASLNVTIPLNDYSGNPAFNLAVSLVWTGYGDVLRDNDTITSNQAAIIYMAHVDGSFRQARVTGSISDGSTDYAADGAGFAQMFAGRIANIVIRLGH